MATRPPIRTMVEAIFWRYPQNCETGANMSDVLKVIEVLAESPESWEDAANIAIAKASQTVHGIKSIYIKNFEAHVENNKINSYRINAKVTFTID
jgi:flavin-binding protein dodecin